jgi:hypothetical protein
MSLGGCSSGDGGGDNADFSIGGNVTDVAVSCINTCTLGGTVTGLVGSVVLQNNGGDDLTLDADGGFSFATTLADGDGYNVTVETQPATQTCTISNASGSVSGADVSNVAVTCATPALDAEAMPSAVRLTWSELADVTNNISNEKGSRPDRLITDGPVNAIAQDADGVTYLGGTSTLVGMRASYGLTLSASTGYVGAFPFVNDIVRVAVSDGAGGFYIGGDFTEVDGLPRNRLAHILANGTLGSWNPDADSSVYALAFSGDTVHLGGSFTSIDDGGGAMTRNHLAAIGTDGMLDTAWAPSADAVVYALAVSDDTVYVGGGFNTIDDGNGDGPQSRSRLAAIGTDGALSTTWTPRATTFGVNALAVSGTTVYVGGSFRYISGTARNRLAAIGTDGTLSSWNPDADGSVNALAVSGGTVYVGGGFTTIDDGMGGGAQTRNCLAAIGIDGSLADWGLNVGGGYVPNIDALTVSGGTVYAGGEFYSVGGTFRPYFAKLSP